MTLWREQKMIEWIIERFNEGLSGENYQKVMERNKIESLFLCYTCNNFWAMANNVN